MCLCVCSASLDLSKQNKPSSRETAALKAAVGTSKITGFFHTQQKQPHSQQAQEQEQDQEHEHEQEQLNDFA